MKKSVIVTGGAGFIGSNLIAALNARGVENIVIVDNLGKDEKWKNLVGLRYADYIDKDDFLNLVNDNKIASPEAVFHYGACSSTLETDADYLVKNNYAYSRRLCEWSLGCGARFVFASSAAVYGDGSIGYSDDDARTRSFVPLNMYGYSKQMFDEWALANGIYKQIAGLRFFNVYGARESHKGDMRSMVHKAFFQALDTGEITLFKSYKPEWEDGGQMRDFIYIRDAVNVSLFLYDNPGVAGLFNCGTGTARTWRNLALAVFAALGREPKIRYVEMPEYMRDKYQYFTQAELAKLRGAGYTDAFTTLEEGVRDYVQNHLQQL